MRILLVGDHSEYHCGCAAVLQSLKTLLHGHEIVADGEPFDALVVNGEGSMHHDSRHFEAKMAAIVAAQSLGKKTYLINTVWQENGDRYDAALRRLDGLVTRGPKSSADLRARHGIDAPWALDLSYFAPVEPVEPVVDFHGATVVTDVWSHEMRAFVRYSSGPFADMPFFDLKAYTWSEAVATLRTAGMIVTGRHHAVYLACRARVPFVAMEGNTHKIEDLLAAAPVLLPVCRTSAELRQAHASLKSHRPSFDALFTWMERRRPYDPLGPYPAPAVPAPETTAFQTARAATLKGDWIGAATHYDRAIRQGAKVPDGIALMAALRGGRGFDAARTLVNRLRDSSPEAGAELSTVLPMLGADAAGWTDGDFDIAPAWWTRGRSALESAESGDLHAAMEAMDAILDDATDPLEREAARLSLWSRAFAKWYVGSVFALQSRREAGVLPDWFARYCDIHQDARARTYHPDSIGRAFDELAEPTLMVHHLHATLLDFLWLANGDAVRLLDVVEPRLRRDPRAFGSLGARAIALAIAAGDEDRARDLLEIVKPPFDLTDPVLAIASRLTHRSGPAARRVFEERAEATRRVVDRLADRGTSVAVVGNGPVDRDDTGRHIDGFDLVVRFNDFVLDDRVGHRVDLDCTVLQRLPDFGQPNLGRVRFGSLLMQPGLPYLPAQWDAVERLSSMGHAIAFMPDTVRRELQRQVGTTPSSGLHIVALLRELRGDLGRVEIFGMPLLEGSDQSDRLPGGHAHSRHDWEAEARVFARLRG